MSNLNDSVDTRNWDFMARSERVDLFGDDLDKTSATDFFNRTNGLGSPEYYLQKRIKDQENKENAKVPRTARGRSIYAQKVTKISEKEEPKFRPSTDDVQEQKQREDLRKRFSGVNLGPVALPEHPKERRSSIVKNPVVARQAPVAIPEKPKRISSGVIKQVVKQPVAKPVVVKQPVVKPVAVKEPATKPVIKEPVVKQPIALPVPSKARQGPSKPLTRPPVMLDKSKKVVGLNKPVFVPERPKNSQAPAGPVTRSREAERRRQSFMQPTESSLRRSVSFARPASKK